MARRNAQQSSRRNTSSSSGRRRVTSQGGFPQGAQPDLYPLVQQIAHSVQRYKMGQSPYQQYQVNPGGRMQGQDKSPGPGRKVNPGGPQQGGGGGNDPWAGTGVSGPGVGQQLGIKGWEVAPWAEQWMNHPNQRADVPGWGMNVNPGGPEQGGTNHNHGGQQHDHPGGGPGHTHDVNPGGPQQGGQNPVDRYQAQSPVPTGNRAANLMDRFNNYGQYVNHFQDPNSLVYRVPPISRDEWQQMQSVNPGGPNQPGGGGGGGGQGGGQGGGGGGQGAPPPFDPSAFERGQARPYTVQGYQGTGPNAMSNQDVRQQYGPQGFGLNNQPLYQQQYGQQPQPQPIQGHQGQGGGGQGGGGGGQGGGGGGGQGGGGQQQPPGAINPPPTGVPGTPGTLPGTGTPTGFSPTLGNQYQNFQSYAPGQWQAYSGPEPQGIAQGTYFDPTANDTQRFTYDTFANGQTYKPMPTGATGGPGNANYPFQGYAPPPQNIGYFNQGAGWNWPTDNSNYQQKTWDQYAQTLQGMPGTTPYFKQNVAPSAAQDVWWANPVVTDPGYYDPWAELRNLQQHFGDERPGTLAGQTALGIQQGGQGQLDYYRYLAHQAGLPGYAQLTGPLAPGYHSPNIGGTYGAHG